MIHRFDPSWGTHIPVLIKCLERTTQNGILELGLGISSTPLLHALCEDQDRQLFSYDNDPVFVDMFKKYRTSNHVVELVDWEKTDFIRGWGLVLLDLKPDSKRKEVMQDLIYAEYLVIHDSEPEHNDLYHYDGIYPLFKYRYDYTKTKVHTTVLNNFHDLDFLHNP
jgi:hypothetical protein